MKACGPAATAQLSALGCRDKDMGYQHLLYAMDQITERFSPDE
jgi:hypothetical protein